MSPRQVPTARRSQLVTTYGVGALFPAQNESFMVMGLEEWADAGLGPEILEARLARSLRVSSFHAPAAGSDKGRDVPVIRLPEYQFCPECRRLAPIWEFGGWNEHVCKECDADLVPSRFVVCCPRGHIDDFPYHAWLHGSNTGIGSPEHRLRLHALGRSSSLSDIRVSCTCGTTPMSLEGAFAADALRGVRSCSGRRPWLGADSRESCTEVPRTLQRGSSNVWFPVVASAISIPPWSEGVYRLLDRHWSVLAAIPPDAVRATLSGMALPAHQYTLDELTDAVLRRRGETPGEEDDDLRVGEYKALVAGRREGKDKQDFVCEPTSVPPSLADQVVQVSRVSRLREVRALRGFTRILPRTHETPDEHVAPLTRNGSFWLPAIEVTGEGVFLRLDGDRLATWESGDFARGRAELLQRIVDQRAADRGLGQQPVVTARDLLLHSLAHALVEQLSLDAGYPSASLRERVFSDGDMAGVLVYTATSDSGGSLGGVAAQSEEGRMQQAVLGAMARLSWCSSDPVCIESVGSGADALNLAACHACLLVPETSCERNNTFLDRATLVGTPENPEAGFFSALLSRV
ncbi:DrmB family protein [Geodermatophilus sp. SYSU D00525]